MAPLASPGYAYVYLLCKPKLIRNQLLRFEVISCMSHPSKIQEDVYIFADVSHLLKNLKSLFLSSNIYLPQSIACRHHLPTVVLFLV